MKGFHPYQPKTGQRCSCKRGVHRDNCPVCEGTGWVIDFKAIRDRADRVAKQAGQALNEAYPFGYRSQDEP